MTQMLHLLAKNKQPGLFGFHNERFLFGSLVTMGGKYVLFILIVSGGG